MNKLSPQAAGCPPKPPRPPLPPGILSLMIASAPRKPRRPDPWRKKPLIHQDPGSALPLVIVMCQMLSFLAACSQPASLTESTATLSLSFGSPARAFAPLSAAVTLYSLSAAGPGGLTQVAESDKANLTLELSPGEWTILVEGRASDGRRLVSGSIVVTLAAGERRSATLVLLPEGGTGTLTLSWSTVGIPGPDFGVEGVLHCPGEADVPLAVSGLSGTLIENSLPAGSWSLELRLVGPGGSVAGLADSVLIVSGCETSAAVVFEPPAARLALALVGPRFDARGVSILPPLRRIAVGGSASFSLPASSGPGSWYREGNLLAGAGAEISLSPTLEGRERIDWVSTESFSALSGRAALIAAPPASFGPLSWMETLVRADLVADGASKALDGCRDLVFSADGAALYLAGKDGLALGRLSLTGGASPLLDGAISKAELPDLDAPTRLGLAQNRLVLLSEGSGSLLVFSLAPDGTLTSSGGQTHPDLLSARDLALAPDGSTVYLASETGDSIVRVDLGPDGSPRAPTIAAKAGDPGLELLDRPLALALSADGGCLSLGSAGDDALYIFSRDVLTGDLALSQRLAKEAFLPLASLSDVVDLAFGPDGTSLFALSYYGKSLIRLESDAAGTWAPVAASKSGVGCVAGFDYPKRLAPSPDGKLLVVSGGGAADGLAAFSIDGQGKLLFLEALLPDGSDGRPVKPGALAFSPDGGRLAVASPDDDRLALFAAQIPP